MTCAYLFPPLAPSSSSLAICTALTPVLKQGGGVALELEVGG